MRPTYDLLPFKKVASKTKKRKKKSNIKGRNFNLMFLKQQHPTDEDMKSK